VDYGALLREVERLRIPAVVLLHGPETLLRDDALRLLSRALFPDPSMAALDREVLDAREVSPEAIARSASTLPFMAARRLVVVTHAETLPARNNEALVAYLRRPSDATCLLLLAVESLRAGRERKTDHWLLQAVAANAIVELVSLREGSLDRALRQRALLDGLEISDDAARLLRELVGDDLGLLLGEAHKAALAGGPDNRRVGAPEVRAVVGEQRVDELFDLTRAVEQGDRGAALRLLERLLGAGEDPLRILWLLTNDLRTVWTIKDLAGRGQSAEQIARRVRRPRAVIDRMLARATTLTVAEITRRLGGCWEVERRIKGRGEPHAEMTVLIADLC
jgi:DNA polymerase-3 subunit delta